jgi:Ca-activated chloride channel family protein
VPTVAPTATPGPTTAPTPTLGVGEVTLGAPDSAAADTAFQVSWTGPNAQNDYITIVPAGAADWNGEQYFYTAAANPGTLTTPTTTGSYELWYVRGADDAILGRRPITVTAFVGSVTGPDEVEAGSSFDVGWTGPSSQGDYVTIVPVGSQGWDGESYFRTDSGTPSPGTLVAPIDAGDYELWYAAGSDDKAMARSPIHVRPYQIVLNGPDSVKVGREFTVKWKGPDGPSDYITIVPVGSNPGVYASYAYTRDGTPAHLVAPDLAGDYEIRYQSDRVGDVVFGSEPITVRN